MSNWPPPDPVLPAGQHGGVVAPPFKHRCHRQAVSAHPAPCAAGNLGSVGGGPWGNPPRCFPCAQTSHQSKPCPAQTEDLSFRKQKTIHMRALASLKSGWHPQGYHMAVILMLFSVDNTISVTFFLSFFSHHHILE